MANSKSKETGFRTFLGFDFGTQKIGVAVGQELTATATPLQIVRVINLKPDWLTITEIFNTWRPDAAVVGIPLNMDDSEQSMTQSALRFQRQLEGRYQLPVYGADERLTSREATSILYSGGKLGKIQAGEVDPVAAQLILETWLQEHKNEALS